MLARRPRSLLARTVPAALLGCALAAASTTRSTPARAEPSLSDRESARSLMDDGDAKRDKGDFKAALKSYEAADVLMRVPTTSLEVARTQAQLGLLLEARETLGRVMRLPPKPGEPAPFTAARRTAESLSTEIGARIPSVTVLITNSEPGQAVAIVFDGEIVPPAAAQAPRKVNPGHHTVIARSGTLEKRQDLDVAERESKTVTIDLKPVVVAAARPPEDAGPADSSATALPTVLMFGGFGLGIVGLGVGAVTGLMSISQVGDVKDDCVGDLCPASRQGDIDSAKSLGTVSTVAFIVGAAGIGAGVVGLVLHSKQAERTPAAAARLSVRPAFAPTYLGLTGTF